MPPYEAAPSRAPRKFSRWILWAVALIAVIVLGVLGLFEFRKTTVTVTPRTQTITFDQTEQFVAYPVATAATGTLAYTVQASDLQESEVVPTQGTEHADVKASGNITVFNDYSTSPVKLIATTRFATPDGLIFRVPADIVVPGKNGSTPGQVSVTVSADQSGDSYNVGPVSRFTLPGLKSNAAMYANVYAQSSAAMTGGFSGDRPAAAPGAITAAQAEVRAKLAQEAQALAQSTASTTVFANLMQVTYQDLPETTEAGGGVRIHEQAHVEIAEFDAGAFAQAVAQGASANAEGSSITFVPGAGLIENETNATSTTLGTDPIEFTFSGAGQLVWSVDAQALASALAGRDQGAFNTIVNGFPGVQEAHARIEPFWKSTFPSNPADIFVQIETPKSPQ